MSDNGRLILVDRWGIEQPARKVNGRPQSRKIAATPPEENGPDMRKIRAAHAAGRMDIQGTYDLAQTTVDNAKHWAAADNYDADSANSRWVRQTMVKRSRYEAANNGYVDGIQSTHATFVVRKGPRLRILTETEEEAREGSPENIRNEKIKRDWRNWCKRIKFRRKLWTMAHAKIQDGEPIAVVRYNPKVRHDVKLDVCLIETELREAIFTVTFAPKSGGQLQPGAGPQSEGLLNGFPKKPPAAGDAESGDAAEVKKLAAMVATMSEGILAMQQTLRGIVGQAFQPDTK